MTKRNKGKKVRKKRKAKRPERDVVHWAETRARELGRDPVHGLTVGPPAGQAEMSAVMKEFAEPLLADAGTPEEWKEAVSVAVAAWNLALLPRDERRAALKRTVSSLAGLEPALAIDWRYLFTQLVRRKEELFPDIDRPVMDFRIEPSGDGFRLFVLSATKEPPAERP